MKLNGSKSKVMINGSKCHTSHINFDMISDVTIGGEKLEFYKSMKNLGIIFDENLNVHVNDGAKLQKVYGVLNRIRHTKRFIPDRVRRDISLALIDRVLSYGDVDYLWLRCPHHTK